MRIPFLFFNPRPKSAQTSYSRRLSGRTLRVEELEDRRLLSVSSVQLTDGADADNTLVYDGTSTVWTCGTATASQTSMAILQNETGQARLNLHAESDSSGSDFRWAFNESDASTYWNKTTGTATNGVLNDTLTWITTGTPTRAFTLTVWEDVDGDSLLDTGEDSKTLSVNVEWANITICVNQAIAGDDTIAVVQSWGIDAGHGFWDNRASTSLISSGIVSSALTDYANVSVGYGIHDNDYSGMLNQILSTGNFVARGVTAVTDGTSLNTTLSSSGTNAGLASWSSIDVYKTFPVSKLSDYLALLAYNEDVATNPQPYILVSQPANGTDEWSDPETWTYKTSGTITFGDGSTTSGMTLHEHQCMLVAMGALEAAGVSVGLKHLADGSNGFEYTWTAEDVSLSLNGQTLTVRYIGTSPNVVGVDLANAGGTYTTETAFSSTINAMPIVTEPTVVTTALDVVDSSDGVISLREAIAYAGTDGLDSTVTFDSSVFAADTTITLTLGEIAIAKTVTIDAATGLNGKKITIDANDTSRHFNISAGTVAFDGLTLINGNAVESGSTATGLGGSIYAGGTANLTLTDCTISSNKSGQFGGGLYASGASLTVTDSTFTNNETGEGGGGLYITNGATLTLSGSTFTSNTVDNPDFENDSDFYFNRYQASYGNARGGGVHIGTNSTAAISDTTFTQNTVRGWFSQGAGLYIDQYSSGNSTTTVTVTGCAFTNNESIGDSGASYDVSGSGIYLNYNRGMTVTNSVISGNTSISCRLDAQGNRVVNNVSSSVSVEDIGGAGVYCDGKLTLTGCEISGNLLDMRTYGGARTGGNGSTRCGGAGIGGLSGTVMVLSSSIVDNEIHMYTTLGNGLLGGGGIANIGAGGSTTLTNSLIARNGVYTVAGIGGAQTAAGLAGGVGAISNRSSGGTTTITNCTLTANTAAAGAGVYAMSAGASFSVTFSNSIVAGNLVGDDIGVYAATAAYVSLNAYNTLSTYTASWSNSTETTNKTYNAGDVLFVDAANGDYRLAAASAALDSGNNSYVVNAQSATDLAGNARIHATTVDMGAFELIYTKITSDAASVSDSFANALTDLNNGTIEVIVFDSSISGETITLSAEQTLAADGAIIDGSQCFDNNGSATVTITGGDTNRLFTISGGTATAPVEIIGVILTGGDATGSTTANDGRGGALYVESNKYLKITDCVVTGNAAANYGGAVYVESDANVTVSGTSFTSNTATSKNGGAIFALEQTQLTITDTQFKNNSARNGGALCVYGTTQIGNTDGTGSVSFGGSEAGNTVSRYGGAIFNCGTLSIYNASFIGNRSAQNGGAIINVTRTDLPEIQQGVMTLVNCTFTDNKADSSGTSDSSYGNGGAIGNWAVMTITGGTFSGNSAYRNGGAMINGTSGSANHPSSLIITGALFTENEADYGGAITNLSTLTLDGCTFGGTNPNDSTSLGNTARKNGGALSNGSGASVTFTGTESTTFLSNSAIRYGGAVMTGGSVTFETDPTFSGNSATFGSAIANGNTAMNTTVDNLSLDVGQTIYHYGVSAALLPNATLDLSKISLPAGQKLFADLDGDKIYTDLSVTDIDQSFAPGIHEIAIQIVDENSGETLDGTLSLEILTSMGSVSVRPSSYANGQVLKLNLFMHFPDGRLVTNWQVNWGDETIQSFDSFSVEIEVSHVYDVLGTPYDLSLQMTDNQGNIIDIPYLMSHEVLAAPVEMSVESNPSFAPLAIETLNGEETNLSLGGENSSDIEESAVIRLPMETAGKRKSPLAHVRTKSAETSSFSDKPTESSAPSAEELEEAGSVLELDFVESVATGSAIDRWTLDFVWNDYLSDE